MQIFSSKFKTKLYFFARKTTLSDTRQSKTKKVFATISAIFCSFFIALIIACSVCDKWSIFGNIVTTIFSASFINIAQINTLFSNMAILIVASLAFIFAYKAGLFNIGISGQMVVAGTVGTIISHLLGLGKGVNQIVVLFMCMVFGSLVAILVGALKAFLNVNEVVSSIMLNWIAYFFSILVLSKLPIPTSSSGDTTAQINSDLLFRLDINGTGYACVPLMIMACLLIVIVATIINYTVLGRKQKIIGLSKTAALASGYNVKLNMISAMGISGAIAGVLGAMIYCGFDPQMPITAAAKAIPQDGFNGISVGLIAMCSPIATVPISLLFSIVQTSVSSLQTLGIDNHIAQVLFGIIVYGAATIALFVNIKPYWLTLKIFKGIGFSKIKHEQNLSCIALLDITNDYIGQLHKYYYFNVKNLKIKSSLKLSPIMKLKIFIANIKYHYVVLLSKMKKHYFRRVCAYSHKKYFIQEMTHLIWHKKKLVIDTKRKKKFGGWWIKLNDDLVNSPYFQKTIQNITKHNVEMSLVFQLKNYYHTACKYSFDPSKILLIPKIANLQNIRSGLEFRNDIARQNALDRQTLLLTNEWAKSLDLPPIKNRKDFTIAYHAFIRAWEKNSFLIRDHYKNIFMKYSLDKKKNKNLLFDITSVRYNNVLIEQNYINALKKEIKDISLQIYKPLILNCKNHGELGV